MTSRSLLVSSARAPSAQDVINPRTHADVMTLSPEDEPGAHPFWYARVLGSFHAKVYHTGPDARNRSIQHFEFLWVRWFGIEPDYQCGFSVGRLPKIGFVPESDESAFGFLDPSLVLRGCHLVPCFHGGRTSELLTTTLPTAARPLDEKDDWANFYVMIFVDRDMFMRFFGGAIGHLNHKAWERDPTGPGADMDVDVAEEESGEPSEATTAGDGSDSDSDRSDSESESDSESDDDDDDGDDSEADGGGDDKYASL